MLRTATFLTTSISLLVLGCASDEERELPPLAEVGCAGGQSAGAVIEMGSQLDQSPRVWLSACGALSWLDAGGTLRRSGPELVAPSEVATAANSAQVSQLGDQVLVWGVAGERRALTWYADDGASHEISAERAGFLRDGLRERAWACVDGSLGELGREGWSPWIEGVPLCDRVWVASDAPVLVFVDETFALAAYDARTGQRWSLADIPFIAASADEIVLSRDGRVLYHTPRPSMVPRLGIFDVRASQGDRLLAALESSWSRASIQSAPRSGHAALILGTEPPVVVTPSLEINAYPDATLLALDPEGERALVTRTPASGAGWDLFVSDLDAATLRRVGVVPVPLSRVVGSEDGTALVAWERPGEAIVWRWEDETFSVVGGLEQNEQPVWVSNEGATFFRGASGFRWRNEEHGVVRTWTDVSLQQIWGLEEGAALIHLRDSANGSSRLLRLREESEVALWDEGPLSWVSVDASRARVGYVAPAPDEAEPNRIRFTIFAGAMR